MNARRQDYTDKGWDNYREHEPIYKVMDLDGFVGFTVKLQEGWKAQIHDNSDLKRKNKIVYESPELFNDYDAADAAVRNWFGRLRDAAVKMAQVGESPELLY